MYSEECCGTCKYHCYDNTGDAWMCGNNSSTEYADYTPYKYTCEEWEEKE